MEELNEKIKGLVKKAEKSGMPYSILKKVYDRGMAAWKTGHRPGTTPQQWAFARVNSFVTKSSGTWGKADKDLADKVRGAKKESIENPKKAKDLIGQVREKLGKDADAGDYIKDFRKSKAPQFKGKSDKKIQKMAIAAYLDSKEEKDLDERLKFKYAVVNTSKNNEVVAMSSDEKDMKDIMSRRRKEGSLKVVKLKRPTTNDSMVGYPLKEEVKEDNIQEASEFEIQVFMLGKILQKHPKFTDEMYDNFMDYAMDGDEFAVALKKSVPRQLYNVIKNHLDKQLKVSQFLSMSNDITEEEKKCPRCGTMNKVPFDKCSNCGLHNDEFATYKAEEVDNSLMAQATRVISKTSIKEKIDPADIDMRATDADRKAADKNIIIQLRRAQDMVKQTGRQDQTGIEFLDRKKQKVDSKIINKALDMFDKMKPNDKAKMQKTIGKSYRDLLKTVQRGRV